MIVLHHVVTYDLHSVNLRSIPIHRVEPRGHTHAAENRLMYVKTMDIVGQN